MRGKILDLRHSSIQRVLLIRLRNIGDVLLTVPTIRAFREAFPRASISMVVNAGTEEMLTGNPILNEVLIFDPRWKEFPFRKKIAKQMKFLWEIRRRHFDLAVNLTEGDRGAFFCWFSGAPRRVGVYHADSTLWWKKLIFHQLVRIPNWRAHVVEQTLEIPRSIGLPIQDKRLEIFYSPEDLEVLQRFLEGQGVARQERLVHIHPTSRWLFKCWRDDGMAKVIDEIQSKGLARVVLTSGGEEREIEKINHILEYCQTRPVNLAGKTTLKQLAALSQRSQLFIGVDTAPMHIAAAVGTPVIALFGPSGEFNWGPWGSGHVVIKKDWECRPCGKDGCQGSKRSRCLEEISEEEVLKEVFQVLARKDGDPVRGAL